MTLTITDPTEVTSDGADEPELVCDSLDALGSILRRIGALDSEMAEIEATARMEKERVDLWVDEEKRRIDHRRAHLASVIEPWVAQRLAQAAEIDAKAPRSVKTPWGKAGFRALPDRVEVDVQETAALLVVLGEVAPDVIRTIPERYEIDKPALKKLPRHGDRITVDGEVLPGVRVVDGEDRFYVEAAP